MKTDYHQFTTINTPKEHRRKVNVGDIWINQATCLECKDTITSLNRHDYKTCGCGKIGVDGGSWYARRTGELSLIKDNIIYYSDVIL